MVKDALLNCKRRPFTSQNMPFYKSICNLLNYRILRSPLKTTFIHFRLYHPPSFCKYFFSLNVPVILYSLLRLSSSQTGRILSLISIYRLLANLSEQRSKRFISFYEYRIQYQDYIIFLEL